jgi:hypothetical protein
MPTMDDPLAGLEVINWSELEHAYGPSDDVPILLRQLQSADPEVYLSALDKLLSSIYHQGSRYSASVEAVPFLYSLINCKATMQRESLIWLVTSLAVGHPDWSVPHGIDLATWQKQISELQGKGRDYKLHEYNTYQAAERGLPSMVRCLGDESASVRAMAAHALAFFPRQSETSVAVLTDLFDRETSSAVRGTIVLAIAVMQAPIDRNAAKSAIMQQVKDYYEAVGDEDGADKLVRWCCATALAILDPGMKEHMDEVRRVFRDEAVLSDLEARVAGTDFPFAMLDLRNLAKAVLARF